jgi:molybdopterin-guanine dinucleotide biosynthesis protein A
MDMKRVGGIVLTGGASSRLGRDKALVEVSGEALAARAARLLAVLAAPVVEAGPGRSGLSAVTDDPGGSGPLSGVVAGARELDRLGWRGPVLVLACDMPGVSGELLGKLASWPGDCSVIPHVGGHPEVLCARYSHDDLLIATDAFAAGERSLSRLVTRLSSPCLPGEQEWAEVGGAAAFADVDTPEDLERARAAGSAGARRIPTR